MTQYTSYLYKHDVESAIPHYTAIKSYRHIANGLVSGKKQMLYNINYCLDELDAMLNIEQGRYEEALHFYQAKLRKPLDGHGLATTNFYLASIYEKLGEVEKQREHLEYVAANGNLLYIARVARDKLGLSDKNKATEDGQISGEII